MFITSELLDWRYNLAMSLLMNDPELDRFAKIRATENRGVWASGGDLYYGAVFGRDSIEVGEDMVDFAENQELVREILLTMASHQGLTTDHLSESEPGRIHHEHRHRKDALNERSLDIFSTLTKKWGGKEDSFVYYGSVDATPLFLRLVGKYVRRYGSKILDERIIGVDGNARRFVDHAELAGGWLVDKINKSDIGLIE